MDWLRRGLAVLMILVAAAFSGILVPTNIQMPTGSLPSLPSPVVLATLLLGIPIGLISLRLFGGVVFRIWRRVWPKFKRSYNFIVPKGPLTQFATGTMILIILVIVITGALPSLVGGEEDGPVELPSDQADDCPDADDTTDDNTDTETTCEDSEESSESQDSSDPPDS